MITLEQKSRMSGHFMIEKHQVDPDGNEIPGSRKVVAPWQDNMVVDSGLDNMAAAGFMARCSVGAGNAAPAAGDTELESILATVNGSVAQGPRDTDEGWNSIVGTYVFGQGVATGIIAEVGVRPSSGNLTTRALIEDENGNPATINKGPMDVLTVTYQMREYPDQADTVSQVTNPHTSQVYDVVQRTLNGLWAGRMKHWHDYGAVTRENLGNYVTVSNAPLVDWDAAFAGSAGNSSSNSRPAYTAGNYYADIIHTWNEGAGNIVGGISRAVIGNTAGNDGARQPFFLQASFDPPIDKDNTKTLIITLRKSWGRL